MRIESKLCHISESKAVVQVNGWLNEQNLGSALAEGPTVEVAEDKAISRLNKRINNAQNNGKIRESTLIDNSKTLSKVELPKSEKIDNINIIKEPSDWSDELAAIDLEIKRLKWSREDEINFLNKIFGYNNRNKITNYKDLVRYLDLLKKKKHDNLSNTVNQDINSLINESDQILRELSWDHLKGREYLQREFNVSTRKELNNNQLIQFVEKLKSIRNQYQTS